jgi:pyridoxal phosphate enzyme (YggS family)
MVVDELTAVRRRISAAASRSGRSPDDVTLVAVSKGQPASAIAAAYGAGHRDFGENRAAELAAKAAELPGDIRWHFVGTLQSRKVATVRTPVTLLHSLDRLSLVEAWSKPGSAEPTPPNPPPPVLVQVNVAGEAQKHGVAPADLGPLLAAADAAGLRCRGLMTIPPVPDSPEDSRVWFGRLEALRTEWSATYPGLTELSMGMTDDLEVAVEAGATLVRVGQAIFGARGRAGHNEDPIRERGH